MLMSMASEWTWVVAAGGGGSGLWDSGEQTECARSEMPWVLGRDGGDGKLGLGLGVGSGTLGLYSERMIR